MKIIVAPDSFKECLTSREAASVLSAALRERFPGADILPLPLADGGEGTADVLTEALGGRIVRAEVTGPLGGKVSASYGIAGRRAILDVASACGIQLVSRQERNPLKAVSTGVGELLLDARERGCTEFIVGLGGSATCDGGSGLLSVPGIREEMAGTRLDVLCDVDAPFVGPAGAARVFGPQKGASPADVEVLERRMLREADRILAETGVDVRNIPGAGAAGGLGGAFLACLGASLRRGIDAVLDLLGFDSLVAGADLVVTGEGRSDRQTLGGKAAFGVLRRSGVVPVALVSGRVDDREDLLRAGFRDVLEASPRDLPLERALEPSVARANLSAAASRLPEALER